MERMNTTSTRSVMQRDNFSGKGLLEDKTSAKTIVDHSPPAKTSTWSIFNRGSSKVAKTDGVEDENKELKELYEMVLKSKREALEIMNMKIAGYEKKVSDKKTQIDKEKEKYDNDIKQLEKKKDELKAKLKSLKESLHQDMELNDSLKKELEAKREEMLKKKEEQTDVTMELNKKMALLQEKKEKLKDKEGELERVKQKLMKYQDMDE